MAKTSKKARSNKRRSATKYDVVVKAKVKSMRIIDINNETARLEINEQGQVTGKHYSGVNWDTIEATMLADGSATLTVRYLHMTKNGESITGIGTGTRAAPNRRGIAKVTAEGTMWTLAPKLSHLNGGRWKVEGEANTIKETVEVPPNFNISNLF